MVRSALAPRRQRLCLLTEIKRKTVLPLLQQAGGASICSVTGWQAHRGTWLVYLPCAWKASIMRGSSEYALGARVARHGPRHGDGEA